MKRLLLCILLACSWSVEVFADVPYEVTRDRRRLAYKTVTECMGCEGRNTISCEGSGLTRCRPSMSVTIGDQTLSGDDFDNIDATVERLVEANNGAPGKFVFDNRFLVVYQYNDATGKVTYQIYSLADARARGLI